MEVGRILVFENVVWKSHEQIENLKENKQTQTHTLSWILIVKRLNWTIYNFKRKKKFNIIA